MFVYRRRVQFYETDAQGVVHHSNYFRYFEEARGEFLRKMGLPYSQLRDLGYEVVLLEAYCSFRRPLLYDEEVQIHTQLVQLDRYFFSFHYTLYVEDDLRAEGRTRHAIVRNGKLSSLPPQLKELLKKIGI
ncbi:thioesterase superfamily protein [Thermocrinis albus DSM 14484]|uniref:Thioesterase superfamily protein n=1 Tax=Thermocrinis albus (strain DSM 14484 / JCM 11386 / HI 11/12) TaxID=638303 RepID=D3SQH4_THEAH|nr:thioesterase family protein [Thermocrinis albus]ADC89411.1 thioesterase superfamily protein [Thermocrinis albus DSM 14484]